MGNCPLGALRAARINLWWPSIAVIFCFLIAGSSTEAMQSLAKAPPLPFIVRIRNGQTIVAATGTAQVVSKPREALLMWGFEALSSPGQLMPLAGQGVNDGADVTVARVAEVATKIEKVADVPASDIEAHVVRNNGRLRGKVVLRVKQPTAERIAQLLNRMDPFDDQLAMPFVHFMGVWYRTGGSCSKDQALARSRALEQATSDARTLAAQFGLGPISRVGQGPGSLRSVVTGLWIGYLCENDPDPPLPVSRLGYAADAPYGAFVEANSSVVAFSARPAGPTAHLNRQPLTMQTFFPLDYGMRVIPAEATRFAGAVGTAEIPLPLDALLVRFSTYLRGPNGVDGQRALEQLADSLRSSGTPSSSMVIRGDARLRFTLGVVLRKVDRSELVRWLSSARSFITSNTPVAPITVRLNGYLADCAPSRARALVAAANDAYERVRKTAEVGDLRLGAPLAVLSDVTIQGASCDQVPSDVAAALDAVGPNIGVNDDARHIATALAYVKVTYAAF